MPRRSLLIEHPSAGQQKLAILIRPSFFFSSFFFSTNSRHSRSYGLSRIGVKTFGTLWPQFDRISAAPDVPAFNVQRSVLRRCPRHRLSPTENRGSPSSPPCIASRHLIVLRASPRRRVPERPGSAAAAGDSVLGDCVDITITTQGNHNGRAWHLYY